MTIFKTDVFIACKKLNGTTFDIIFADPPYNLEKINEIPAAIFNNDLLAPDGIAIIEHPGTVDFSSEPNFSNTASTVVLTSRSSKDNKQT